MHPAPSLIVFTVLSGLGFGALFWAGLTGAGFLGAGFLGGGLTGGGLTEGGRAAILTGMVLAVAGLGASVFHLGRPSRAWRALSQWRSSWLSREAWAAGATLALFVPVLLPGDGPLSRVLGALGAVLALVTVLSTAMIYRQIRAVPRWRHPSVPLLFAVQALAGGAILFGPAVAAVLLLIAVAGVQAWSWIGGDHAFATSGTTLATATGIGKTGSVRSFEWPHTGTNYLLREMVHVVGRRHARTLRILGLTLLAPIPAIGMLAATLAADGAAIRAGVLILHLCGAVICRWLFYAQAEHVVGLYYGLRDTPRSAVRTA